MFGYQRFKRKSPSSTSLQKSKSAIAAQAAQKRFTAWARAASNFRSSSLVGVADAGAEASAMAAPSSNRQPKHKRATAWSLTDDVIANAVAHSKSTAALTTTHDEYVIHSCPFCGKVRARRAKHEEDPTTAARPASRQSGISSSSTPVLTQQQVEQALAGASPCSCAGARGSQDVGAPMYNLSLIHI